VFSTPQASILEDPVTGSAHLLAQLIPFLVIADLGKEKLKALQNFG